MINNFTFQQIVKKMNCSEVEKQISSTFSFCFGVVFQILSAFVQFSLL